jgi:hypothetical protein
MEGRGLQADPKVLLWVQIAGRHHHLAPPAQKRQFSHLGVAGLHSTRLVAHERESYPKRSTNRPPSTLAVIAVEAPPQVAKAALPLTWLATDDTFTRYAVRPGDEMLALGFPEGFSSNAAGFPILRSGRVASFPLAPSSAFPTFLLDLNVFPGNSGGPIYMSDRSRTGGERGESVQFVAGMLTQEVERGSRSLGIAVVTDAKFIREALGLLDHPEAQPSASRPAERTSVPAGATSAEDAAYGR